MMRTWKWLGWLTILAGVLVSAPLSAQEKPENPKGDDVGTQLRDVLKKLDTIQKQLDKQLTTTDVELQIQNANAKLREELEILKRKVDKLERQRSPYTVEKPFAAPVATGRIRLVNQWATDMTVVVSVNGIERRYRLPPNTYQDLENQPAGTFFYQVVGVQPEFVVRNLPANETYTITVYPR